MSAFTPRDVGMPAKFTEYRHGQAEAILDVTASGKRFSLLSAPTGTGKSLIYMSMAGMLGVRTLVLVGTKGLQTQLLDDFSEIGMVDIRGSSNYPCREHSRFNCRDAPCHHGTKCELMEDGCHYYDARRTAFGSSLVVSNYAYWVSIARYTDPGVIGEFGLLVMDEAHTAPDWLARMCTVKFEKSDLREYRLDRIGGLKPPYKSKDIEEWAVWALVAVEEARDRYREVRARAGAMRDRDLARITLLGRSLKDLVSAPECDTAWIVDVDKYKVTISPVWAAEFADKYLFRDIPRVVLSSATLSSATARHLGIAPRHYDIHTVDSVFSSKRRPFIWVPTTKVDRKMTRQDVRKWVDKIDQIIESRLDRKGIIHTRSYERAYTLREMSAYGKHMITHTKDSTKKCVARFKKMKTPAILVSPSVEEGHDFPYDLCRWQIVAKVPFVNGNDPLTEARTRYDKKYPMHLTSMSLTQMAGRGMRSRDDFCETIIVDDHWRWFKHAGEFPDWFRNSWRRSARVPKPLRPKTLPGTVANNAT